MSFVADSDWFVVIYSDLSVVSDSDLFVVIDLDLSVVADSDLPVVVSWERFEAEQDSILINEKNRRGAENRIRTKKFRYLEDIRREKLF